MTAATASGEPGDDVDAMLALGLRPLVDAPLRSDAADAAARVETRVAGRPLRPSAARDTTGRAAPQGSVQSMADLAAELHELKRDAQAAPAAAAPTGKRSRRDEAAGDAPRFSLPDGGLGHLAPEMQRLQRTRALMMRHWARLDVAEVVRRAGPSTTPFAALLRAKAGATDNAGSATSGTDIATSPRAAAVADPIAARDRVRDLVLREVDPLEAKAREETAALFRSAVARRAAAATAADSGASNDSGSDAVGHGVSRAQRVAATFDVLADMTDAEVAAVAQSGAIDVGALWEGGAETAELPNEYFARGAGLALTRELADAALPHVPSDDEARTLANVERRDAAARFGDAPDDLRVLEDFERRAAYSYTEQPNLVLRHLSRTDRRIRESLEVMDRARRALLRDGQFQGALGYVHKQEAQEVEQATNVRPVPRQLAAEAGIAFFDRAHSRPPLRAQSGVPTAPAPRDRVHDPAAVAKRRAMRDAREMFVQSADGNGRGDSGGTARRDRAVARPSGDGDQWFT
jgi:hypothetical protein